MGRLTENDRRWGPLTWARSSWSPLRAVFSTGGDGDDEPRNSLTVYLFGWVARLWLPMLMQPHRVKHIAATWNTATVERMGRNWYYETFPREFGFSLHEGFLQVFLGPQTHDSRTTKSWSTHLPWTQWRFYRFSLYGTDGAEFWTQIEKPRKKGGGFRHWEAQHEAEAKCDKVAFLIDDFDGQRITATTHIQEREWKFGEGWFKWLSLFRRNMVRRSLGISFDKECGPEKGSWKGGTMGTGIEMLPGELHEDAFRRYCEQDHHSKYQTFRVKFVARVATERAALTT